MAEINLNRISEAVARRVRRGGVFPLLFAVGAAALVIAGSAVFLGSDSNRLSWTRGLDTAEEITASLSSEALALQPVSAGKPAAKDGGHIGSTYSLDTFVVNINDRDRDRYLKMKAELELEKPELAQEMEARLPQIRDLIISLLGNKSFDDIRTIEGKNFLREELLLRINSLLVTGEVRRIFFTEFVVQ
jgi:flagellar basal body-associated protein FliL